VRTSRFEAATPSRATIWSVESCSEPTTAFECVIAGSRRACRSGSLRIAGSTQKQWTHDKIVTGLDESQIVIGSEIILAEPGSGFIVIKNETEPDSGPIGALVRTSQAPIRISRNTGAFSA
jgi:hypothetical protein